MSKTRHPTHLDESGNARMVDVGPKQPTRRRAVAEGTLKVSRIVINTLDSRSAPKGDAFGVARIAGIQAAKRTSDLIPLCHPLHLSWVGVDFAVGPAQDCVVVRAEARTAAQTGVEMEAITAATIALLTLYDMLKSVDKSMVIGEIRLIAKSGGKSGDFQSSRPALFPKTTSEPASRLSRVRKKT
jgi:cyclic pyranopterin phosphate synthase